MLAYPTKILMTTSALLSWKQFLRLNSYCKYQQKNHDITVSIASEKEGMYVKNVKMNLSYRTPSKEGKLKCILQSEWFFATHEF